MKNSVKKGTYTESFLPGCTSILNVSTVVPLLSLNKRIVVAINIRSVQFIVLKLV